MMATRSPLDPRRRVRPPQFGRMTLPPGFLENLKNIHTTAPKHVQFTRPMPRIRPPKRKTTTLSPRLTSDNDGLGNIVGNIDGGMAGKGGSEDRAQKTGGEEGESNVNVLKKTGNGDGEDRERGGGNDGGIVSDGGGNSDDVDDHDADENAVAQRHRQGEGEASPDSSGGERKPEYQCQPISGKHSQYIMDNLEKLQAQCQQFSACTEELYSASNYHLILAGESTRLKNICGLMYANGGGQYTTLRKECSANERQAVRQTIGGKLQEKLAVQRLAEPWKRLRSCVKERGVDDEAAIDTVCRLKVNGTGSLCGDERVNGETRTFFNHELEHLHCSCVAINAAANEGKSSGLGPLRFAIAGGVICLLIVLIVIIVVLCLRHRKTKRKLKEHRMRHARTKITPDEPSAIYQEIGDAPNARPKLPERQFPETKLLPRGYELDVSPRPSDPEQRYVRGLNLPLPRNTRRLPSDDDDRPHSYLEPLPDPVPVPGSSGQGRSHNVQGTAASRSGADQGYKGNDPYSLAKQVEETHPPYSLAKNVNVTTESESRPATSAVSDGTYFDTIKLARAKAEDEFGYSKLRCPERSGSQVAGAKIDTTADRESSSVQYFELESDHGDHNGPRESTSSGVVSTTRL